ncbi:membrane protein [Arthrobacter phage Lizalica]|uniref:Membrane protein n=1 Tax=Arthrobacter phage Lizalica TaxID=2832319 RepID=A0AA48Y415_9CAUD|nr:membrane protein [Arthrobacter phage Lizalica]UIW13514.1 membrane protein [Arthrobacter phage Lizalica]
MGLIAALVWAVIVSFGPVHLDFWTEMGLIFIGAFILGALGDAAEK